jgi:hypothetical protein
MQVLSQLSYNPTIGPLIGADIVAPSRPGSSPGCSAGEFRVPSSPAFTISGSLLDDGQRVLLPRHRVRAEYISHPIRLSIGGELTRFIY